MSLVIEAIGRGGPSFRANKTVLLPRSCTSTTFERTALIPPVLVLAPALATAPTPAATPVAAAALLRARGAFEGLTVVALKLLLVALPVGVFAASATERLPCGVPEAPTFFFVFLALFVVFFAFG